MCQIVVHIAVLSSNEDIYDSKNEGIFNFRKCIISFSYITLSQVGHIRSDVFKILTCAFAIWISPVVEIKRSKEFCLFQNILPTNHLYSHTVDILKPKK